MLLPLLNPACNTNPLLQLVQEIETQAINAQREISIVKSAVAIKQRDARLLELTASEVKSLPQETNVYEGIGKMYVSLHFLFPVLEKTILSAVELQKTFWPFFSFFWGVFASRIFVEC